MTLQDVAEKLRLHVKTGHHLLVREPTGGYAGDMLSDVLAHSRKGDLWVTLQTHVNIVPVASMKELSGIIIVNGRIPEEDTLIKAAQEKVPVLVTEMSTFRTVGMLHELGIRG